MDIRTWKILEQGACNSLPDDGVQIDACFTSFFFFFRPRNGDGMSALVPFLTKTSPVPSFYMSNVRGLKSTIVEALSPAPLWKSLTKSVLAVMEETGISWEGSAGDITITMTYLQSLFFCTCYSKVAI